MKRRMKKKMNLTGKEPFKMKAKKPEPDDKSRPARPTAHTPKQKGVVKRAKRLQGVMI